MIPLLTLVILLHLGDLGLTIFLLNKGWMEEGNPFGTWIYKRYGAGGLVVFKIAMLTLFVTAISLSMGVNAPLAMLAGGIGCASGGYAIGQLVFLYLLMRD